MPNRRATLSAASRHGPEDTGSEFATSARRRDSPAMRTPTPTARPEIQIDARTVPRRGRLSQRDSLAITAPFWCAPAGETAGSLAILSEELATDDDQAAGKGMDHAGTISSSAGIHKQPKRVVARTQCRIAAERRRSSIVAMSAPS